MSEIEKKRRDDYQKDRNEKIRFQMIVAILLVAATLLTFIPYAIMEKNSYVNYAEEGKIDARAYLADNTFYDEKYLDSNHAYIADLVKSIEADFNYALAMDAKRVNYTYSYKIDATVNVIDRDSKAPLYDPTFVLKEVNNAKSSDSELYISESVKLDYAEYNDIAEEFVHNFGVTDASGVLVVRMHVRVLGECETLATNKDDDYTMELRIPLLRQTLKMTEQSSVPSGEQKILACDSVVKTILRGLCIIFAILSVLMGAAIGVFVIRTRDEHIDYARRVQKLLSNYKSYIQRISTRFNFEDYQVLKVVTFEELLEIGDKICKPVLMYENKDKTRAEFFVPTDNGIVYLYVIEVDNASSAAVRKSKVGYATK